MAVAELPSLVSIPHPLVADQRALCYAAFEPRETLKAYIERSGIVIARGPVAVWHNGYRVPDELWGRLIPRKGDQVIIRGRAEGGGGGNKVLRTVALVVVAIAAVYTAGAAGGAAGWASSLSASTGVSTGVIGAAAAAAISIGGSLIVNALIPLPTPNLATSSTGSSDNAPSYQIQASRNTARVWEPMLLVMGGPIKVVPDLANNPSTSGDDDQYLSQAFHFGLQPDLIVTGLKIGDTPIENFQGVQIQRSGWDGVLTNVYENIDTIQGFDVNNPDGWNSRTTPTDTVFISIQLAAILYSLDTTTGEFNDRDVVVLIQYRPVGGSTWTNVGNFTDPVYATHYWAYGVYSRLDGFDDNATTGTQWTQVSYGSTNPSDHVNGERHTECQTWGSGDAGDNYSCQTFEWRWLPHPFQLGRPWQGIAPDPLLSYVTTDGFRMIGNSNKPVRATVNVEVPLGQYEVRIQKASGDINTNTDSNVTSVTQIKAYQYIPADFSGQLRYGLVIRATSQLNGPIEELSAICQAQCNVWNGSAWVYGLTRNPAWWFLWFALGKRDPAGNKLYGACIPEAQIDVESIKAWGAYCDAHGWKFDYVLAQKMSAHDVLTLIARTGQASYSWQSGKLGIVWDAADLPVVAMIGPYNIKAGTFEVSYVDGTVDEIIGNFINKDRDWLSDQVRARVPGAPLLNNPQTFDLEGVVDASVAGRMVNLLAASQNFHRRRVAWEMDIEGYIATRGDVVQLSHDLTVWGYAGRLTGGTRLSIQLDRSVPIEGSGWVVLRGPENQMATIQVAGLGEVDSLGIPFPETLDGFPMPGDPGYEDVSPLDWAWQYDPLVTPGRRLKVVSVQPTNDEGVRFEAVDDNPAYYQSEYDPFAYTPPRDGALLRGIVLGISFEETITNVQSDTIEVRIDWVLSAAMRVNIDYAINGQARPTETTVDRFFTVSAHTGDVVSVTINPVSATGLGNSKSAAYTVVGQLAALPTVTGLTSVFRDGLTTLTWQRVVDIRQPVYEVRLGSSWEDSRTVAITPNLESLAVGDGLYFVAARFVTSKGKVIYGPADSLLISGATLVRNVLATVEEDPSWIGDLSEDAFVFDDMLTLVATGDIFDSQDVLALDDVLWFGGVASQGIYHTAEANIIDIGYPTPVRVDFAIEAFALNFSENVLAIEDVLSYTDILNASNQQHYAIQPQIRTANVEGEWSDWADYVPGLLNARYFDVRLVLTTDTTLIVPFVTHFSWTIDVPDLIQKAESVVVPAAGLHITFPKPFHAIPNIQVTQFDAEDGDRAVIPKDQTTLEGFDIYFLKNTTPIEATMNYLAQGY